MSAEHVAGRRALWALVAFGLASVSSMAQQVGEPMPDVLILTTGGTIASRTDARLVDGNTLVGAVPEVLEYADVRVEEFSVIGSSRMTPAHWLALARTINQAFAADSGLAGIVITHGTDTMEETAYFLNLTVKSDRPVVLVGSMRSSNEVSADGSANLINAVRVATDEQAVGQGVLVVLNEDITAARDVRKTDNRRVQTFGGGNAGHIGSVDPDGVRFNHQPRHPHTTSTEFDVSDLDALPEVLILSDFTGISPTVVETFGALEMDGLVIRTFAGGRMSEGMLGGLESIAGQDLPMVVTSRVPNGRIVGPPAYGFPAVVANGQQDSKARILLMLALSKTTEPDQIQRIFDTY